MAESRRLPAYAAPLADARRRGFTLRDPVVSVGLHWRKRRPGIGFGVVVPDDVDPATLDWSFVRGLEVLLWRRGDPRERVRAAIRAIRASRPCRLVVVDVTESRNGRIYSILRPENG